MVRERRYLVEFVNRRTHERRSWRVYAFNSLDADLEGYRRMDALLGESWRSEWWPYGARREAA